MDTLEWPEYNSDKATVGSVVCMVYTGGQPYKPCVLCETGLRKKQECHDDPICTTGKLRNWALLA